MSASGGGDDQRESRIPSNMKGLMQFCIEQGSACDNPDGVISEMSAERREWLESALNDMTSNPVNRMKEGLGKLNQPDNEDDENLTDEKISVLEEMMEWCENIDLAIDFHKIGGYEVLKKQFDHSEPEIRWNALELLGILVQNNPYCQDAALKHELLPLVLHMVDNDSNATVRTKALFAISCLCRDVPDAQKVFVDNDGFSVVMRAMQSDVEKLKIKAAFMLSSLCNDKPEFKDIMCDIGMIDQLVGHLQEEHSSFHEHIMSALLTIVRDNPRACTECQRHELNLLSTLNDRVDLLKGKEEFQEEREYATELLRLLQDQDISDVAR
ncbi:hsp70-binding protein 1-like [Ylistrum balloti]|uniref:hsp70-binding protein 1-like n=1 Tax=Ylistrum balloti TaxID=509963 RepID=UPI002905AC46|nr:hsp70-binding protein 1-like [Ylistrum balloti]